MCIKERRRSYTPLNANVMFCLVVVSPLGVWKEGPVPVGASSDSDRKSPKIRLRTLIYRTKGKREVEREHFIVWKSVMGHAFIHQSMCSNQIWINSGSCIGTRKYMGSFWGGGVIITLVIVNSFQVRYKKV